MGIAQMRERVFFICKRKDLKYKELKLGFYQKPISVYEAFNSIKDINTKGKDLSNSSMKKYWDLSKPGEAFSKYHPNKSLFTQKKIQKNSPCFTITAGAPLWHYESPRKLSDKEACVLGSYPLDYKFKKEDLALYMIGMSVPPLMTYGVANQVYHQWFKEK